MGEDNIFKMFPRLPEMVVAFIKSLVATIAGKNAEIDKKDEEIKALQEENQKLKEQLSLDSHNSSLAPSSDRNKPNPKSLRTPSGNNKGGQKGHKGNGIKYLQTREPDKVVEHWPNSCDNCSNRENCIGSGNSVNTQYEYDVMFVPVITKHNVLEFSCPLRNGERLTGTAPLNSTHEYGKGLQAFNVLMYTYGTVSYDRIKKIVNSLFGFSISTATIYKSVQNCKKGLESTIDWIKDQLIKSSMLFLDETGFNINGKNQWIHGVSNGTLKYMSVQEKRGYEGMILAGVLEFFKGIGMHDCWSSYSKFEDIVHALCNAHLLRELVERWENTSQEWAQKMIVLLLQIKSEKEDIIKAKGNAFTKQQWNKFKTEYDSIVAEGLELNPLPDKESGKRGRPKKGKSRNLLERLRDKDEEFLRFATDFSVPFDNNEAERLMRHAKIRVKVSGCMREVDGAQAYCDIMSYLLSTKSYDINALDALHHVFNGTSRQMMENLQPAYG